MTVGTMLIGLVPLLWAEGSGADVMKRIAAPMVGGLVTSAFLTLEIIPVIYTYWRAEQLLWRRVGESAPARLPALQWSERAITVGLFLAAAVMVLRVYLARPPAALMAVAAVASMAAALSLVAYVSVRRGARLAVERAALE
jgi:hypothetical protein